MPQKLEFLFEDFLFGLTVLADGLILFSVIFTLLYAVLIAAVSTPGLRGRLRPSVWGLPLVLALSAFIMFSPAGGIVIKTLASGMEMIYRGFEARYVQIALAGLWLFGFLTGSILIMLSVCSVHRRLNALKPAPPDPIFDRALGAEGMTGVDLNQADDISSAVSWGLVRKRVVTPPDFKYEYSETERYGIYLHELTHLKNRDSGKYLLIRLLKALFWFNPLMGWALDRYKCHLEIICDRSVIEKHELARLDYSRLMARTACPEADLGLGFSSRPGEMIRRMGYIWGDKNLIPVKKDRLIGMACLFLAASGLSLLNPDLSRLIPEPGSGSMVSVGPDGQKAILKPSFYWQGALGSYTIVELTGVDDQR